MEGSPVNGTSATISALMSDSRVAHQLENAGRRVEILNHVRLINNIRKQDAQFQSLAATYQETVLPVDVASRSAELVEFRGLSSGALKPAKAMISA